MESDDSLISPDDLGDLANEEPPSISQLKTTDMFQFGHKKNQVDSIQNRKISVHIGGKEPHLSNPDTLVRPTSVKKQMKVTTSRKSPSSVNSDF